jgi:hypothetical protein
MPTRIIAVAAATVVSWLVTVFASALAQPGPEQGSPPPDSMAVMAKWLEEQGLKPKPSALAAAVPGDNELQKLRRERYLCAFTELQARTEAFAAGIQEVHQFVSCLVNRVVESELALCRTPQDRVTTYARAAKFASGVETILDMRFKAGRVPIQDLEAVRAIRLEFQVKLLLAKEMAAK